MGKPASFGATDIGQLSANGFTVGQVPKWNGTKFVGYTIPGAPIPPGPTPSPLPPQDVFVWDVPSILPLQSAFQDFPLIGAVPGEPIAFGISFDIGYCLPFVNIFQNDLVRLRIVNMDSVAVDLGSATWSLQRFGNT